MPQQRNSLIKRASLYPLSFDNLPNVQKPYRSFENVQRTSARGRAIRDLSRSYSQDSYEGIFYLMSIISNIFNIRI